jgi:hypothetical protein
MHFSKRNYLSKLSGSLLTLAGSNINVLDRIILWTAYRHDNLKVALVLTRFDAIVSLERLRDNLESDSLIWYCDSKYGAVCHIKKETFQKYLSFSIPYFERSKGIKFIEETFIGGIYKNNVANYLKDKGINCMSIEERDEILKQDGIKVATESKESDKFLVNIKYVNVKESKQVKVYPRLKC